MARSVKFLGKLEAKLSDQETREGWWSELRDEVKSHARVMCCSHVIGYSETCTLVGDVYVLSAVGTAAILKRIAHPSAALEATEPTGSVSSTRAVPPEREPGGQTGPEEFELGSEENGEGAKQSLVS